MKAIWNVVAAGAIAYIAYKVGATEGNNVKEKVTNCGLKAYVKSKELIGQILPKKEEEAPAEAPAQEN